VTLFSVEPFRWCKVSDGAPRQAVDRSHGAPLRLRLERQLGYKMAKYITRIELVQSLAELHGGRGGYRKDRGYEWDAGIAPQRIHARVGTSPLHWKLIRPAAVVTVT
jgi:DMSO/TMAO reductase YedYZ molybdopterin-dependent catalytic subunit